MAATAAAVLYCDPPPAFCDVPLAYLGYKKVWAKQKHALPIATCFQQPAFMHLLPWLHCRGPEACHFRVVGAPALAIHLAPNIKQICFFSSFILLPVGHPQLRSSKHCKKLFNCSKKIAPNSKLRITKL